MPQTEHYSDISEVKLHYVQSCPEGVDPVTLPCLVFVHGFPEYWATWQQQLDYFGNHAQAIALDLPGYNLSGKPEALSQYALPQLIAILAEFIQRVAMGRKVVLIAHDWGGAIAWPLAAFHGDMLDKLVILNAAHPSTFTREMIENPEQRRKSEYIHELIAKDSEQRLTDNNFAYLQQTLFAGMKEQCLSEQIKRGYLTAWAQPGAVTGMLNYYRAMPQLFPSSQNAPSNTNGPVTDTSAMKIPQIRIEVPTLVLWGEQDAAFDLGVLRGLENYVPYCSVQRFVDASHWLQHEKSAEVNSAIESFVNS